MKNFKENDIRPEKLRKEQQKYVRKDINFLKKNKKNFHKVNCPACNGKKSIFFLEKETFQYRTCTKCKTFYMSPRPNKKLLETFYNHSLNIKFWNDYMFPLTDKIRSKKIFKPRVKKIIEISKNFKIKNPSILDVGSGFGTFCKESKKTNFFSRVTAIEASKAGAENCKKNGIEVFHGMIENISELKKKYDIVTSFEVIEHLHSIKDYIKKIKKFVKPNGILILTCPNGDGFDVRFLLKNSATIDHEHLNYFNPNSIILALKKLKLEVKEIFTPGKLDLDIVKNTLKNKKIVTTSNYFFDKLIFSENKKLSDNFQKFLVKNNLSSNMWVVARFK